MLVNHFEEFGPVLSVPVTLGLDEEDGAILALYLPVWGVPVLNDVGIGLRFVMKFELMFPFESLEASVDLRLKGPLKGVNIDFANQ